MNVFSSSALLGVAFPKPYFRLFVQCLSFLGFFWHSYAEVSDKQQLQDILGPDQQWQVDNLAVSGTVNFSAQKPFLIAGPAGAIIHSAQPIGADSEVLVRLRLGAFDGQATGCSLVAGLATASDASQNLLFLALSVAAGANPNSVAWSLLQVPGKPVETFWPYTIPSLPKSRITWPAKLRDWVEQEQAKEPRVSERWLTLRYVIRKSSAQIYLDGRLLRDAREGVNPTGYFRMVLSAGTQLSSVQIQKLSPEDIRFEPIALDSYLNASHFRGSTLQRTSLLSGGTNPSVAGIPFAFPTPDEHGNDHIDVGASWMNFGFLDGDTDPIYSDTPRWAGPMRIEPNRLAFRVRNAPYKFLHLIASFDGAADKVPVVSAQFYHEAAGLPVNFSASVPAFTAQAGGVQSLPVSLADGRKGNFYLITIPLDPNGLAGLAGEPELVFELTKAVQVYRAYPDPSYYSEHGGGLPSGVHVYAMTLERPPLEVDLQPDKFAHLWTAPEIPSYTVQLKNNTDKPRQAELTLSTQSHDGLEKTTENKSISVPALGQQTVQWPLPLQRYGYHSVVLRMKDAREIQTETRSLAYLHPDTREKKDWREGEGPLWGFWNWDGGHGTPDGIPPLQVAAALGFKSTMNAMRSRKDGGVFTPEELSYAKENGMKTYFLADQLNPGDKAFLGADFDANKPAEMGADLVAAIKKSGLATPGPTNDPQMAIFFSEVALGSVSYRSFPEYYGDPPYQLTAEERTNYNRILSQFVIGATAIKKEWPPAQCYFPYGNAAFIIPFLRESKEATRLMDGPAVDQILFERLPEMQMGQITYATSFWQMKQEWIKAGKAWPPHLVTIEGGGLTSPATPGGLTLDEEADQTIRGELMLIPYGVTRHLGEPSLFRCSDYWGEQHYGGGLCDPMPLDCPKVVLSAYATMTRQLDGMNFVKSVDTGSASVFCLQFKHYRTGKLLDIFWTLRGTRPVSVAATSKLEAYDSMDNELAEDFENQKTTFSIGTAPCYVGVLSSAAAIVLGKPNHSDAKPAENAISLGNLGNGNWKVSTVRDDDYETVNLDFIKKFPGAMSVQRVPAPAEAGGHALAVHLGKQETERNVMPYYTTLVPSQPITMAGKPSHLGLWVKAASDWGRVVYCLRDAKGGRWLSIGCKNGYNQDDPNCWSQFCFDGWRYLRFELPGNEPWDLYRDAGSSWWGDFGKGDGIVDLPLTLEKIIVERRTHVIKVDNLIPASADDVLLGGLNAEYRSAHDEGAEAIQLSQLEMPTQAPALAAGNPIRKLAAAGTGLAPAITRIAPPEHDYDGTSCVVSFDPVPTAKSYDVWVSTNPDGRDAVQLGADWTGPGQLLSGLPGNVTVYLFLTYTDKDGKTSRPSEAKRVQLSDDFPFK